MIINYYSITMYSHPPVGSNPRIYVPNESAGQFDILTIYETNSTWEVLGEPFL